MIVLIIGGSSSGKSAFAEDFLCNISEESNRIYIATMEKNSFENEKKIRKHRFERKNKNFFTIEQSKCISDAYEKYIKKNHCVKNTNSVIIESVSNLLANEMFELSMGWIDMHYKIVSDKIVDDLSDYIVNEIAFITKNSQNCVIVSDNIFEGGLLYDELTNVYIEILGEINRKISCFSDILYEVTEGMTIKVF